MWRPSAAVDTHPLWCIVPHPLSHPSQSPCFISNCLSWQEWGGKRWQNHSHIFRLCYFRCFLQLLQTAAVRKQSFSLLVQTSLFFQTFATPVRYDQKSAFASLSMCFSDLFRFSTSRLHTHTHTHISGLAVSPHIDSPQRWNFTASPKLTYLLY